MKIISVFLLLIVFSLPAFAQDPGVDDNSNLKFTRQGFGQHRGIVMSLGFENPDLPTDGSAYYFNQWETTGVIYTKDNGRLKIDQVNINLYNNSLEAIYEENKLFTFNSENLVRMDINDKVFRPFEMDGELKMFELFYHGNFSIYRHFNVNYVKGSANPMLNRKSNKYTKKEKYYLYEDGRLSLMKLTRKSVSNLLQSNSISQEGIADYIKQNRLSLNDEGDLIQLLKYVDNQYSK